MLCTSGFTDDVTFSYHGPIGGQTGTALCSSPAPVDVATEGARAAVANWFAGSTGRLAGLVGAAEGASAGSGSPVAVLAVRQLDSAATGDGPHHSAPHHCVCVFTHQHQVTCVDTK